VIEYYAIYIQTQTKQIKTGALINDVESNGQSEINGIRGTIVSWEELECENSGLARRDHRANSR
jgi:hypothetical protein